MNNHKNHNSIKPNLWGPHGWKFMHYVSLGYPENPTIDNKNRYKNFYYSLQDVLPCEKCRENYKKNIMNHPIDPHLENKESLIKWVIDIHNKVNQELNKETLDYQEATNLYLNATEDNPITDYCFKIIILLIILYFLYILFKK